MKPRRLPMTGEMVRATLRETDPKTVTRRVMWPRPDASLDYDRTRCIDRFRSVGTDKATGRAVFEAGDANGPILAFRDGKHSVKADIACPYGAVGARLIVTETWAVGRCADGFKPRELSVHTWVGDNGGLWYAADDAQPKHPISERGKWRPGRFMPGTWASRITLEITGVRAERLQDISEADAVAEGVEAVHPGERKWQTTPPARERYRALWDSLNADRGYGWDVNPWVWVIEFKRIETRAAA